MVGATTLKLVNNWEHIKNCWKFHIWKFQAFGKLYTVHVNGQLSQCCIL